MDFGIIKHIHSGSIAIFLLIHLFKSYLLLLNKDEALQKAKSDLNEKQTNLVAKEQELQTMQTECDQAIKRFMTQF